MMGIQENLTKYLIDRKLILCNYDYSSFNGDEYHYYEDGVFFYDLYFNYLKISKKEQLFAWGCKLLNINRGLSEEEFTEIMVDVSDAKMEFCVRSFSAETVLDLSDKVYSLMVNNKLHVPHSKYNTRHLIFNPSKFISKEDKRSIIGSKCGKKRKLTDGMIYEYIETVDSDVEITNNDIAKFYETTPQTVSRNMTGEIKDYMKEHNQTARATELYNKAIKALSGVSEISLRQLQEILNTRNVPVLKQAIKSRIEEGEVTIRTKGKNR